MNARGERGVTLVEVLIATALAVSVIGVLLGTFDSVTRATAAHEQTLDARADLRQAAAEVARDLRAATSVIALSDPAAWRREIAFTTLDAEGVEVPVHLVAKPESGTFVRDVPTGNGRVVRRRTLLRNGRFGADPRVFRYYGADGAELDPDLVAGDRIAACATRVEVTLTAARDRGATQSLTVGAALRSRRPEAASC